ncbi:MAG: acyltransferase [Chitinophagaceae bacterium]|nr:MAG: acyltransferase [Chitinophagaceae bacterium]
MKKWIQHIFGLRKDVGINFYIADLFFRKILRQNADTPWAIHHTSVVLVPGNIKRGKNVYPGDSPNNFIEALNGIEIGDYSNIGPNVGILSTNHDLIDNANFTKEPPVKIGRFCWIGMNAVILPGVEIGDFTIVGAGAIVTKSFPAGYCVLGGNPATVIKQLDINACNQFRDTKYAS